MEDTLRVSEERCKECKKPRLNPCFNGRYSQRRKQPSHASVSVLILVLMEDTLREKLGQTEMEKYYVLILVLMEDTLRDCYSANSISVECVLILVLMEDTLREHVWNHVSGVRLWS